jgi:hypothetical protein
VQSATSSYQQSIPQITSSYSQTATLSPQSNSYQSPQSFQPVRQTVSSSSSYQTSLPVTSQYSQPQSSRPAFNDVYTFVPDAARKRAFEEVKTAYTNYMVKMKEYEHTYNFDGRDEDLRRFKKEISEPVTLQSTAVALKPGLYSIQQQQQPLELYPKEIENRLSSSISAVTTANPFTTSSSSPQPLTGFLQQKPTVFTREGEGGVQVAEGNGVEENDNSDEGDYDEDEYDDEGTFEETRAQKYKKILTPVRYAARRKSGEEKSAKAEDALTGSERE